MSIYVNNYVAKAKRFIVTSEERDELIAITFDTYDKVTIAMTDEQTEEVIKVLNEAVLRKKKGKGAGRPVEAGHDDEDFS